MGEVLKMKTPLLKRIEEITAEFQLDKIHPQTKADIELVPLQSSKLSFEYLLLPPRSAPVAASPRLTPEAAARPPPRPLHVRSCHSTSRLGMGTTLQRHPFS